MDNKKQYPLLDVFKLISAIMIIAIHTQPFLGYDRSVFYVPYAYLKCFSIPFFFVSSIYLFVSKYFSASEKDKKVVFSKWLKRMSSLYLIYSSFNFVILALTGEIKQILSLKGIIKFVFLGKENGYLWFIAATIVAVLIIVAIEQIKAKRLKNVIYILLAAISSVLMCTLQFYYKFFESMSFVRHYYSVFKDVRNFISALFYGFAAITVYLIIKKHKPEKKTILILTPIVFLVSFVEYVFVVKNGIYKEEYSTLLITVFIIMLMLLALETDIRIKGAKTMRKTSNVMYFWQRYFIIINSAIIHFISNAFFNSNIIHFFAVVLECIILTFIFEKLGKTKIGNVVKYLY